MRSGVCAFHRFFHHSTTSRSLQHWFLQHSNFSRKVCNILLCNNWKIAGNSCNICLQQKCCKKKKFTTFFKCCKKKANVAKKKPMPPTPMVASESEKVKCFLVFKFFYKRFPWKFFCSEKFLKGFAFEKKPALVLHVLHLEGISFITMGVGGR